MKTKTGKKQDRRKENKSHKRVIIIGGGITGLTAGLKLSQAGYPVTIIEESPTLGGLAASFDYEGIRIPIMPHQTFENDVNFIGLAEEFGYRIHFGESIAGVFSTTRKGKIFSLATPINLARFSLLSFKERIKTGLFAVRLRIDNILNKNYNYLNEKSAKEWLVESTSENIYKIFFEPLFFNKFGVDLSKASAAELATRLRNLLSQGTRYGYLDGGIQQLIDAMEKKIKDLGGIIHTNSAVEKLIIKKNRIAGIQYKKYGKVHTERPLTVISTIPMPLFLQLSEGLNKEYKRSLMNIQYSPYVGIIAFTKKRLTNNHIIYFINSPIGGINDFNNLYGKYPFRIVYGFKYLPSIKKKEWSYTDEQLKKMFLTAIKEAAPGFNPFEVFAVRERYANPIIFKDFHKYVPQMKSYVDGLYLAGMFNIYPEIRDMERAVKQGKKVAEMIISERDRENTKVQQEASQH